jgi:hypothetical protein
MSRTDEMDVQWRSHKGEKGNSAEAIMKRIGITSVISKVLAAGTLSLGLSFCAAIARAQRQPETFFKNRVGLSDNDIQKMNQGQVVTKVLESGDKKYGMLVFGGVYINTTIERFAESYRDVKSLLEDKVYLDVQAFNELGSPPKLSDFDRIAFSRKDIDALQKCKPNDCDLQVFDVVALQKRIDWNSVDKYDQVNKFARQRLFEVVTTYISGGLRAFGSYTDRDKPFNLYQNMQSMLDTSYYLPKDKSGGIYQHVLDYPEGKLPGALDFFYWENIDFGQGPTIRVNRVSMFPKGVGVIKYVVANEQLYASRYIRIALQVFYCVPDTQNPGKPGFYLIEMNDSRLPDYSGIKLSVVRKIATGKGVQSTQDILSLYSKRLGGK